MGECNPQSTPHTPMVDVDTVIDSASGMVSYSLVSSDRPGLPPEALPGSVDVSVRPDQTNSSL